MSEETTPLEDYSSEGEEETPEKDINKAGSEVEGEDPSKKEPEDGSNGRKLDPQEMQKTLNRQFNEIDNLKKQLAEKEKALASSNNTKAEETDLKSEIQALNNRLNQSEFYKNNPKYEPYKNILGDNPSEAIKDENIKGIVEKAIAFDEAEKSKSVLHSNPRLQMKEEDLMEKAKKTGDEKDWQTVIEKRILSSK